MSLFQHCDKEDERSRVKLELRKDGKLKALPTEYSDIEFVSLEKVTKIREPADVSELISNSLVYCDADPMEITAVNGD